MTDIRDTLFERAPKTVESLFVVLRYLVPAIGVPRILPLGDSNVLPSPFPTIRKAEGDVIDVLYVSIIQGSYFCRHTAAS